VYSFFHGCLKTLVIIGRKSSLVNIVPCFLKNGTFFVHILKKCFFSQKTDGKKIFLSI